jgi:hypothetical protein
MTDRELMQVELHALEEITGWQSLAPGYVMEEADEAKNSLRERLARPEKEPVKYAATKSPMIPDNMFSTNASVYTAPPKREWVGLTDEETMFFNPGLSVVARKIEAKLKERNR